MQHKPIYFTDLKSIKDFTFSKKIGSISIKHQNLENYKGVVFYVGIVFNTDKNDYQLNLEWICFALDLFGDNILESYVYQFENLENLLNYLYKKYQIKISNIPTNYKFNDALFPNPIINEDQKYVYEIAWKQFQNDFKNGLFLDKTQTLIYNSLNN